MRRNKYGVSALKLLTYAVLLVCLDSLHGFTSYCSCTDQDTSGLSCKWLQYLPSHGKQSLEPTGTKQ